MDATNIITPIASVITNISLEHTQLLGDTLAKIAFEKAGIIKPNVPVIIGKIQPETMPVYRQRAEELSAPLHTTEKLSVRTEGAENPRYRRITITDGDTLIGEGIRLPLAGDCQLENVATFVRTAQVCEPDRPDLNRVIVKAIENVLVYRWAGSPDIGDVENPFTDVPEGKSYITKLIETILILKEH